MMMMIMMMMMTTTTTGDDEHDNNDTGLWSLVGHAAEGRLMLFQPEYSMLILFIIPFSCKNDEKTCYQLSSYQQVSIGLIYTVVVRSGK